MELKLTISLDIIALNFYCSLNMIFSNCSVSQRDDKVEILQNELKIANKQKICFEQQVYNLRNFERSLCEEIYSITSEIDIITEQLEELKDKISTSTHKVTNLEIEHAAEKAKIGIGIDLMNVHRNDFKDMFAEERCAMETRKRELRAREDEEVELERQKQNDIDRENEVKAQRADTIEDECRLLESECAILKKRNNAIMLKLRRKLIETEDARRELMKNKGAIFTKKN